jgi:tetratricopeptide (TPR) repeat protein/DNA-binding CsgD family transcriptional regulator
MKGFFCSFLILFSTLLSAQFGRIDHVLHEIDTQKDPIQLTRLHGELSMLLDSVSGTVPLSGVAYDKGFKVEMEVSLAHGTEKLGDYFVGKNSLDSAKFFYVRAKDSYKRLDSLFNYAQIIMRLGNINLAQDNHIDALRLYQECFEIAEDEAFNALIPHLYNNLGLLYKQIGDYDDALANFEKAYSLFKADNDEANSVYPLFNKALVQSVLGEDEEAIDGYLYLTMYHLKTKNWVSLASVYNSISEIHLKNKNYGRAKEYLDMALNAMEDKKDSFNSGPSSFYEASIFSNASEVFYKEEEYGKAKIYARNAISVSIKNSYKFNLYKSAKILGEICDKEKNVDSSLYYHKIYIDFKEQYQSEYDVKQLTKLKMQSEFDAVLRENEISRIYQEVAYKNRELKYAGAMLASLLIAAILVLLFLNQRNKNEKLVLKEKNLILEKIKLNQSLEYKKKELVTNLMYLMDKNEFIASMSKKLIELKPEAKKDNKLIIQQLVNEIRINYSSEIWEEFEIRFKEVHTEFYNKLYRKHPGLTPNEVKICAFLRLNMSTKEISAITHQSVNSLNMARFRLRKKLNIDKGENLISYLNNL